MSKLPYALLLDTYLLVVHTNEQIDTTLRALTYHLVVT